MKISAVPLLLLFLALPVSVFGQSTILNFPRSFTPSELGATGFAIVNPSPFPAVVTYTLYSSTGLVLSTIDLSIDGKGQLARLGTELFSNASAAGWVQARSTTIGLQGFWVSGDFANIMDGAEAAPFATSLIFPLITGSTELNVANLDDDTSQVTFRIYGDSGSELATTTRNVESKGVFRGSVTSLFPAVNFNLARYIRATGSSTTAGNISGTTVISDFIHAPSFSVVNGVDASISQTEAYFPHVPSGPENAGAKWTSFVGVTNFSTSPQNITITFNSVSGSPTTVTRSLAGRGSLRETAKDLFGFGNAGEDGWVKVSGSAPLSGFVAYGYNATAGVAVVPVQRTPRTNMIFSHVATSAAWYTGLALLNPTGTAANVEVFVLKDGDVLVGGAQDTATASFVLAPNSKTAKLLTDFVPSSVSDGGFVYIRSTNNVPLFGIQLFFSRDYKVIANIAAAAIDSTITYNPPAPNTPLPAMVLTSVSPASAPRSTAITLSGSGFGTTASNYSVVFTTATGSVTSTVSAATATTVTTSVPTTAITGPVYVLRTTDGRFTGSRVLQVTQTSTTAVQSTVSVSASQTTLADIYVSTPALSPNLNATLIGLTAVGFSGTTALFSSSAEIQRGQTRWLWLIGDGIMPGTPGTTVTISGSGVTVTAGTGLSGGTIVTITVSAGAAPGPRNIILTNTNLDTSVLTGGLIIQ